VLVAWIHDPSSSHVNATNVITSRHLLVAPMLSMTAPINNAGGIPTTLALTRDSTGAIEVYAGPESVNQGAAWDIFAVRPGGSTPQEIIPFNGTQIQNRIVHEISVPRALRTAATGDLELAIGLTLQSTDFLQLFFQSLNVRVNATSLAPTAAVAGTEQMANVNTFGVERAAYLQAGPAVYLDETPTTLTLHDVTGIASGTTPALGATDTEPGLGNMRDGTLIGVVESASPGAPLICARVAGGTWSTNPCGTPPVTLGDLDVAADVQYASEAWFTGATRLSDTVASPVHIVVGNTHDPATLLLLDVSGLDGCAHPRVSGVPGETLSAPQHAVIVASCRETGVTSSKVFAWVVERPAVPDAGTDAATDASSDASAEDVPLSEQDGTMTVDGITTAIARR
jgi:hypothetical protein